MENRYIYSLYVSAPEGESRIGDGKALVLASSSKEAIQVVKQEIKKIVPKVFPGYKDLMLQGKIKRPHIDEPFKAYVEILKEEPSKVGLFYDFNSLKDCYFFARRRPGWHGQECIDTGMSISKKDLEKLAEEEQLPPQFFKFPCVLPKEILEGFNPKSHKQRKELAKKVIELHQENSVACKEALKKLIDYAYYPEAFLGGGFMDIYDSGYIYRSPNLRFFFWDIEDKRFDCAFHGGYGNWYIGSLEGVKRKLRRWKKQRLDKESENYNIF